VIRWTTPVSRKRIPYNTERRDNKVTKGDRVQLIVIDLRGVIWQKTGMCIRIAVTTPSLEYANVWREITVTVCFVSIVLSGSWTRYRYRLWRRHLRPILRRNCLSCVEELCKKAVEVCDEVLQCTLQGAIRVPPEYKSGAYNVSLHHTVRNANIKLLYLEEMRHITDRLWRHCDIPLSSGVAVSPNACRYFISILLLPHFTFTVDTMLLNILRV